MNTSITAWAQAVHAIAIGKAPTLDVNTAKAIDKGEASACLRLRSGSCIVFSLWIVATELSPEQSMSYHTNTYSRMLLTTIL